MQVPDKLRTLVGVDLFSATSSTSSESESDIPKERRGPVETAVNEDAVAELEEIDETDEEDEVEEEIDVFLNNINENSLNCINTYLVQYPLRPKYRPYNYTSTLQNIYYSSGYSKSKKVKGKPEEVEESFVFEYKLHGYITKELHKLNISVREGGSNKETKDTRRSTNNSDTGRLISSSVLCDYVTTCVGFFKYNEEKNKREIHLIPVKDIFQFKPVHGNIDRELKNELDCELAQDPFYRRVSQLPKIKRETESEGSSSIQKDDMGILNGKAGNNTKGGTGENTKIDAGSWENIYNIYDADSEESREMISLFSSVSDKKQIGSGGFQQEEKTSECNENNSYMKFSSDTFSYLNTICKDLEENESEENSCMYLGENKTNTISTSYSGYDYGNINKKEISAMGSVKTEDIIYGNINRFYFFSLSVDEQILEMMRIKNVLTLEEIKRILKSKEPDSVLMDTVKKYCVNILGAWVIKSKYLYKFFKGKPEKKVVEEKLNTDEEFTFVDYKILVRNLLIGLIYKQVEPLMIQFIEGEKQRVKNEMSGSHKEHGFSSSDSRSRDKNLVKKINCTNSILIENFEKATNLPNHIILDIFSPLCEYKLTGYYYKYWIDEEFVRRNLKFCLLYHQKWKTKLTKIAQSIQHYKSKKTIINDFHVDKHTIEKYIIRILNNNCYTMSTIYEKIQQESKNTSIDMTVFKMALSNVAININNVWCLNIVQKNEINNCRNALIQIFQQNYNVVLTKAELIKEVEKRIKCPLNIPDIYFRNMLKEFCIQQEGKYWFKGNDNIVGT